MRNCKGLSLVVVSLLVTLVLAAPTLAEEVQPAPQPAGTFFFAYRTPAHVNRSSSEVFHQAFNGVLDLLKERNVVLREDELAKRTHSEEVIPVPTLLRVTRESGASHLLLVVVDRPATKWIKITVQCYDLSGKLLWEEMGQDGGGMSGGSGLKKTIERIREKLTPRIGKEGLPVAENREIKTTENRSQP
jgi:hypothetical protein